MSQNDEIGSCSSREAEQSHIGSESISSKNEFVQSQKDIPIAVQFAFAGAGLRPSHQTYLHCINPLIGAHGTKPKATITSSALAVSLQFSD